MAMQNTLLMISCYLFTNFQAVPNRVTGSPVWGQGLWQPLVTWDGQRYVTCVYTGAIIPTLERNSCHVFKYSSGLHLDKLYDGRYRLMESDGFYMPLVICRPTEPLDNGTDHSHSY